MKVYKPILWSHAPGVDYGADTIEVARIVPRAGGRRRVYLDKYDRVKEGETIRCIWTPPYTDVNGWMEQPSEIALGYVVTGTAHLAGTYADDEYADASDYLRHVAARNLRVDIDVHVTEPFIDTLAAAETDPAFQVPSIGICSGRKMKLVSYWDTGGADVAHVAGFIYLTTLNSETLLEALLRREGGQLMMAFHGYFSPGGDECRILNNALGMQDRALFEHLISTAEPIKDSHEPYLITTGSFDS